jgi:hypothetical protein
MTKTEQKLLALAQQQGGRASVETAYGRGARGGRASGGHRERAAMFKLQAKGLVRIVVRTPWEDYNRGYKQSGNSFVFELV